MAESVDELKEMIRAERELNAERMGRLDDAIHHARELSSSQRQGDQLALTTALTASKEMLEAHNGLLRKIEKLTETFATKEELERLLKWQSKASGVGLALGAGVLANIVKLWTG